MSQRCDCCTVRHQSFCGALSDSELARIVATAHLADIAAGQVIVHAGQDQESFANILSGVVKLTRIAVDGHQQVVGLQFASDFLGRPFRVEAPFNAEAVTPVRLCMFSRLRFEALMGEMPGVGQKLLERTLDELDAARDWMAVLSRTSARAKVASFLVMLGNRAASGSCSLQLPRLADTFDLPLSRSEIANYLGLTLETVSRQFTQLKNDGIIAIAASRSVTVLNSARLDVAAYPATT